MQRLHALSQQPLQPGGGFTLTELLVALALGSLLLAGVLRVYSQARTAYEAAEAIAELEERLSFAFRELENSVLLAGFWGLISDPATIAAPGTLTMHCGGNDVSAWALQTDQAIQVQNAGIAHPCPVFSSAVSGSDSLTVRHAGATIELPASGRVQLLSNTELGILFNNGSAPAAGSPSEIRKLEISSWYVDEQSSEAGLPSLRRYALVDGGLLQHQEVMPGVADMQIRVGVDRNSDGLIDGHVEPDAVGAATVLSVVIRLDVVSRRRDTGNRPWRLSGERRFSRRNLNTS